MRRRCYTSPMALTLPFTPRTRLIAGAVVAVIVLVIGGVVLFGGGDGEEVTTRESTTTTEPTTTAPKPTYPLTGLPVDDPAKAARPALVVKIDNAEPDTGQGGRPQAGLNQADVVFEEVVEGSVTRLAAIFHSGDSDPVGPVRSARTTDLLIMQPLNRPLFAWSGANANVAGQVRAAPLVDLGHDAAVGAYYRDGDRPAPYNLFSSTGALRASTPDEKRPPPALFTYRAANAKPAGAQPVKGVHIVYGGGPGSAPVDYTWDGKGWARSQVGEDHVDAAGARISPPNVIIRFTPYKEVQCCDASGFPIVEAELVGTGEAWVLTAGVLIKGTWERTSPDALTSYTGADGKPIGLTPGPTWVAIAPPGSTEAR